MVRVNIEDGQSRLNGQSACSNKEISLVDAVKVSENKLSFSGKSRAYFDVFPREGAGSGTRELKGTDLNEPWGWVDLRSLW